MIGLALAVAASAGSADAGFGQPRVALIATSEDGTWIWPLFVAYDSGRVIQHAGAAEDDIYESRISRSRLRDLSARAARVVDDFAKSTLRPCSNPDADENTLLVWDRAGVRTLRFCGTLLADTMPPFLRTKVDQDRARLPRRIADLVQSLLDFGSTRRTLYVPDKFIVYLTDNPAPRDDDCSPPADWPALSRDGLRRFELSTRNWLSLHRWIQSNCNYTLRIGGTSYRGLAMAVVPSEGAWMRIVSPYPKP